MPTSVAWAADTQTRPSKSSKVCVQPAHLPEARCCNRLWADVRKDDRGGHAQLRFEHLWFRCVCVCEERLYQIRSRPNHDQNAKSISDQIGSPTAIAWSVGKGGILSCSCSSSSSQTGGIRSGLQFCVLLCVQTRACERKHWCTGDAPAAQREPNELCKRVKQTAGSHRRTCLTAPCHFCSRRGPAAPTSQLHASITRRNRFKNRPPAPTCLTAPARF